MQEQFYSDATLKSIVLEYYKLDYIELFSKLCRSGYHLEFDQVRELQSIARDYIDNIKKRKGFNPKQPRDKRGYNDPLELAFVLQTISLKNAAAFVLYEQQGFKRKKQAFNMLRYYVKQKIVKRK